MSLVEFKEFIVGDIEEGLFATGGQFYASVAGESVIDLAYGTDALCRTVSQDTLFATYCMGKPVIGVAIGNLVDAGEVSFYDCLGDVIEGPLPVHLQRSPTQTANCMLMRLVKWQS